MNKFKIEIGDPSKDGHNQSEERIINSNKTIEEVRELRKSYIFSPVYSEVVEGNKIDYILNLNVGEQQILVDNDCNFHIRENPLLKASSLQDIQKAICVLAQGYKEGFIKKDKKDELAKILRDKASQFKTII